MKKTHTAFTEFMQYTALNVLGMIGLSCYILADTFFVSKGLGADGLAALNLAIPVYSFIHGTGLMLGIGGATKYSILKGQKMSCDTNTVFTNTVYTGILAAFIFMAAGFFLSGDITSLLGADTAVFSMTKTYLRVIMLFAPAFILNDICICFVRNDGNPRLSMFAMLTGSLSNIILDYLFIFPLDMGIFGAVLATGMAPVISMLVLSMHWLKGKNRFHLQKTGMSAEMIFSILPLGFPSLITELASGIVMIAFNRIILRLQGNTGVAAYGVVANLSLVVLSIYTGIAQGMQPLVSRFYGKGDTEGRNRVLKYALLTMMLLSCGIYLGIFRFAGPIAGIFNREKNRQLEAIAVEGLRLYFMAAPFVGFNIVISMYFTSVEKAFPAQIISLLRGFLLILPLAFGLAYLAGITGVWLAFPVTEGLTAIGGVFLFRRDRVHYKCETAPK